MITFIRSEVQIPSASTLRRDLTKSFKTAKENFKKELQVSNLLRIFNVTFNVLHTLNGN